MENGQYVDGSIYFYAPNKGAPIFFALWFGISGLIHIWQCIHYKCWKLTGLYVFSAVLFTAGFIVREIGAFDYTNLDKYIITVCLVYAAPPIFELSNYNILGRILYYVPYHSPIHPGRVITTFAFISAVVEALNGNGAAYSANSSLPQSQQDTGKALLKAALVIQIAVVILFLFLAGYFHRRCLKAGIRNANLNNALRTLYCSSALLTARTIYRVVEYFTLSELHYGAGIDPTTLSPLLRYEWFFYVFEATLMLCNQLMMNWRHPRRYLPQSTKVYLAQDGVTEITGPGYNESRPFVLTLIDPFDVVSIIRGKKNKEARFWENNGFDGQAQAPSAVARYKRDPEA